MTILLTKRQYVLNILYSVLAVFLLFWSRFMGVYSDWASTTMSMIAVMSLSISIVFTFLGKKAPFLFFGIAYLSATIISIIMKIVIGYTILPTFQYIILALLFLIYLVIAILLMTSKLNNAFVKYMLPTKEVISNVCYTVLITVLYLFMKLFEIMTDEFDEFRVFWNYFGTFENGFVALSTFEIAFTVAMTASAVLYWNKKYKISFIFIMIHFVMLVAAFISNLDCPYRNAMFYVITVLACLPVVYAAFKLKGNIKVNVEAKTKELDFLLKEGVISQDQYDKKVNALKSKNK